MTVLRYFTVLLAAGFWLCGCAPGKTDAYTRYRLGASRDVVSASVEAMGGLKMWESAHTIRTDAVVTSYGAGGTAYTNRYKLTVDLKDETITAEAHEAVGSWRATIDNEGDFRFTENGFHADQATRKRIASSLALILHRIRGPLNMLSGNERVKSPTRTRLGGGEVIRVGVTDLKGDVVAYYFDPVGSHIKYVTAGADKPGRSGTITHLTYAPLPGAAALPKHIEVFRIGRYVLLGNRPVLDATLSNFRIE